MQFAQLSMLNLLWGMLIFVGWVFWINKRRKKMLHTFVQEHLVQEIASSLDLRRHRWKNILLVAVLIFSILALIRPQWGFQWQDVRRAGIDIFVAVDTSKSMLTQDVKPNRLERTKLAIQDLLKNLQGDRIGLIAFAGEAFLVCPLTLDYSGFQISLNDLNVETIPQGGTNLAKAITETIKDDDKTPSKHKAVIIITDGDNLEGDPAAAARQAKAKGVKIYTIGVGTKEGELIQVPNEQGELVFLKDSDGNFVKSRLNEPLLEQIALMTGGVYVKASGARFGLDLIYARELSKFEKRDIKNRIERKYYERFQIPLAIAVFLLVVETCLTTRRKESLLR